MKEIIDAPQSSKKAPPPVWAMGALIVDALTLVLLIYVYRHWLFSLELRSITHAPSIYWLSAPYIPFVALGMVVVSLMNNERWDWVKWLAVVLTPLIFISFWFLPGYS